MSTKSVYVCQNCGYRSQTWPIRCSNCNKAYTFVEERALYQQRDEIKKENKQPALLLIGKICILTGVAILPFAIYASVTGEKVTLPSRHGSSSHTGEQLLWMAGVPFLTGLVLLVIYFFTMDRYK